MELVVKMIGHRCDLALHPISANSADIINRLGRKFYTKKYLEWWRQGHTCTCGVKYDGLCAIEICADGNCVPFNPSIIGESAALFKDRAYLDSKVQYLALMGYDDEYCETTWTWRNVDGFDLSRMEFLVHRWDRIIDAQDYLIIEDILFDGRCADDQHCGKSNGFNLVDPRVIDLEEVRRNLGVPQPSFGDYARMPQLS